MRDYGKVYTSFWSSQNIQDLSDDGKVLALYLMTCQHNTISGVFRLPDGYAAEDLKWSSERVSKGFTELLANGFANRCETTKWVWVIKHFEWNAPENPNQVKAAKKCAQSIPDECAWKPEFMRLWGEYLGFSEAEINKPLSNPSGTLSKPGAVTGAVAVAGKEIPPNPPKGGKKPSVVFRIFLDTCKANSEKPIPEDDKVFEYADEVGIPLDFLRICWHEFAERYSQADKKYKDWRAVFRKAVRGNWMKIWYADANGQYALTTVGIQAQRVMQSRNAA
jgi:hypothetical protein